MNYFDTKSVFITDVLCTGSVLGLGVIMKVKASQSLWSKKEMVRTGAYM